MTGRRFRLTCRLQFLLVVIACLSCLLATYSYFNSAAQKQLAAVGSLAEMGINAFPSNCSFEFQEFTFSGSSSDPAKIALPVVSIAKPSGLNWAGRKIFGDAIFSDFSTIIVQERITGAPSELQHHISNLPNLKTLYYYENTLDSVVLKKLMQSNPKLGIEELVGSPPMTVPSVAQTNSVQNTK